MNLENTIWTTLCIIFSALALILFFLSGREKVAKKGETVYFRLMCLACFCWAFFSIFIYVLSDLQMALDIAMFRFIGIAFAPIAGFLHVWHQISAKPMKKRLVLAILILPAITSLLAITNKYTGFFLYSYFPWPEVNRYIMHEYNWGYIINMTISYIAGGLAFLVLVKMYLLLPKRLRKSVELMLLGVLCTVVSNLPIVLHIFTEAFDPTIVGISLTLLLLYFALNVTRSANMIVASREYLFNNLFSMILVLDADKQILDWNENAEVHFCMNRKPTYLEYYDDYFQQWIAESAGRISKHDSNIVTFTREEIELHFRISTHEVNENHKTLGYLVEISEITSIYSLLRYLEESAMFDHLTGLYNRNAYAQKIEQVNQINSYPISIILGDVNNLKQVNDEFGHLAGDQLLQYIAQILVASVPENSFIARIGGDEFVIILSRFPRELCKMVIEKINNNCQALQGEIFGIPSIALGVAEISFENNDWSKAIEEADREMYADKRRQTSGSRPRLMKAKIQRDKI